MRGIPAAAQSIALACSAGEFGRDEDGGGDNGDAVDYPTVEKLNKILRVFVSEYLELA